MEFPKNTALIHVLNFYQFMAVYIGTATSRFTTADFHLNTGQVNSYQYLYSVKLFGWRYKLCSLFANSKFSSSQKLSEYLKYIFVAKELSFF